MRDLSHEDVDALLEHTSTLVDIPVNAIKCRFVILIPLPRFPFLVLHPSRAHGAQSLDRGHYLCAILQAFNRASKDEDVSQIFVPFQNLVKGAVVVPYNCSGII